MDAERAKAWKIFDEADLVCSAEQIDQAIVDVAARVTDCYAARFPVVLCVMNGGVFFCARLLTLLHFPLTLDYVHATRYGPGVAGREVTWRMLPQGIVTGRDVLVVDDILDAGETLKAIRNKVMERGATSVAVAVLAEKMLERKKPVVPEFVGVNIPDRFVFGCGLDVAGFWRNLPAIYAVKDS